MPISQRIALILLGRGRTTKPSGFPRRQGDVRADETPDLTRVCVLKDGPAITGRCRRSRQRREGRIEDTRSAVQESTIEIARGFYKRIHVSDFEHRDEARCSELVWQWCIG
jgi:hypothetical protein